ncbi:putative C6 transcription factor [Talaromyces proteolyticus]|uniref:C6 transcription factor n=1 Tax=Talaromyces proteolyticus TaxID=1131652 RepID=A0AAD4KJM2_9EURO|nr:putative C6 transcription factor [Talaromyces proteolyticus]KAH8693826.1 putative C6 transcription factor [Talaromyces proteolyticus]
MPTPATTSKTNPGVVNAGSRPYRSHKVRACDLCRKRKSRCTVDIPGQSCVLCRVQGADCHYQEDSLPDETQLLDTDGRHSPSQALAGTKRKRGAQPNAPDVDGGAEPPSNNGTGALSYSAPSEDRNGDRMRKKSEDRQNESVLIVGPVAAEDAQVIEKFMPSEQSNKSVEKSNKPYNVYSNDPRKPILYTKVSRRRQGVRLGFPPGENQKEILEHLLGPFKQDLVRLFIDRFNVAFPVFDGHAFWEAYISGSEDEPPTTLLCHVYAMALVYWKHTPKLARHPKPDVRYAINLTVAALHEDYSQPGLSTVGAALLDLTGRPIFSMTGNAISCGRLVSLAHCLGLNRDPSNWKIPLADKKQRIRLWWGVVIHDRWGSFGHGVPPQISKIQYDVPLPSVEVLVTQPRATSQHVRAAHCHISLCRLTEILGELLPLVYQLQTKPSRETSKRLRHIRTDLDTWEDSLPEWLRAPVPNSDTPVSGVSSLHLAFLATKMLVCRVELHEINTTENDQPDARRYFQTELRKAAEEIVHFMTSLQSANFREFWLPYSAFHLTSTATLLVRCALETTDQEVSRSCLANVENLQSLLRRVREEEDWDVADMCLDHCERILNRYPEISNMVTMAAATNHPEEQQPIGGGLDETLSMTPAAIILPETTTNNDIVEDMMSISGTFGTMDGFPFDMTGIWDVSGIQDVSFT